MDNTINIEDYAVSFLTNESKSCYMLPLVWYCFELTLACPVSTDRMISSLNNLKTYLRLQSHNGSRNPLELACMGIEKVDQS